MKRPPLWGNFIGYADEDILSIGLLHYGGMFLPAFYHATQAVEKYFKVLILSIHDPDGSTLTSETEKYLKTHNLEKLASYCSHKYPYYCEKSVLENLKCFSEYDQATRYPWVNKKQSNGFKGEDFKIFEDLLIQLRNDLPIKTDDYMLGMAVRGFHHHYPDKKSSSPFIKQKQIAVETLRSIFPRLDEFVRWPSENE